MYTVFTIHEKKKICTLISHNRSQRTSCQLPRREQKKRRKRDRGKRGEKLTSSKNPQNNASFYNHWAHKVTIDCFLPVVYLICIELPFLEAWVHVLGLNLRLGGMDLEMLILSLRKEKGLTCIRIPERPQVNYKSLHVHSCSISCIFLKYLM